MRPKERTYRKRQSREKEGWRNKKTANRPDRRQEIEKKRTRERVFCVSLIKERTGYKPKKSGRSGHVFPITLDWHQS